MIKTNLQQRMQTHVQRRKEVHDTFQCPAWVIVGHPLCFKAPLELRFGSGLDQHAMKLFFGFMHRLKRTRFRVRPTMMTHIVLDWEELIQT